MDKFPSPPWTALGKKLESQVRKALHKFELLNGVEKLGVALSGGKDSLTLLFLLKAIVGRGFPDAAITALHITGEFSCGAGVQTSFLKKMCEDIGIPLIIRESTQKRETLECYSCSRERRKLLFDAAKEQGISHIAFGHHRDDSVQTLLMNLLQKGEFAANLPKVPMHRYGVTIIRPMILVAEEDIRNFAKHYGLSRVMCRCPVGQNSMRKKVDTWLSEITEHFPHARENLAQSALLYGSDKALTL